jgi:hypothetical protein
MNYERKKNTHIMVFVGILFIICSLLIIIEKLLKLMKYLK